MAIASSARIEADVLAVAAEEREFAGLFGRAESKRRLIGWPVQCAWLAVVGTLRWLLVSDGPGALLAGRATSEALSRCSVRCILSTGLCGALDARLEPGDTVHAAEVIDGQGARWEPRDPRAGTKPVRLLSTGRVAVTVVEKRGLAAASGAAVVEMEAAAVAAQAARSGLPFYCLRVVSDGLKEELPMDFNRYRDGKGRFSRVRIAAACALRPWAIPALLRFDRQCRCSAEILGECLVHARFA